jgi:hypothetical protein
MLFSVSIAKPTNVSPTCLHQFTYAISRNLLWQGKNLLPGKCREDSSSTCLPVPIRALIATLDGRRIAQLSNVSTPPQLQPAREKAVQ